LIQWHEFDRLPGGNFLTHRDIGINNIRVRNAWWRFPSKRSGIDRLEQSSQLFDIN